MRKMRGLRFWASNWKFGAALLLTRTSGVLVLNTLNRSPMIRKFSLDALKSFATRKSVFHRFGYRKVSIAGLTSTVNAESAPNVAVVPCRTIGNR